MKRWILVSTLFLAVNAFGFRPAPQVKATATGHNSVLTWTAPAQTVSGMFYNAYRGTAAGAESTTPINSSPITQTTYTDTAVQANGTYFYIVKACAVSAADGSTVCGAPSNEATDTIPLLGTDLGSPGSLTVSGN